MFTNDFLQVLWRVLRSWEVIFASVVVILYVAFVIYVARVKKKRLKTLNPIRRIASAVKTYSKAAQNEDSLSEKDNEEDDETSSMDREEL